MDLSPYLNFNGQCEAALKFYERCLGGKLGEAFRYAGSPMADQAPADWQDKIMHASITIGGVVVMAADLMPEYYKEPQGFSMSLQLKSAEEAERVFKDLAQGGKVLMPIEKTFWAERFGMVVDQFGIPWLINCE